MHRTKKSIKSCEGKMSSNMQRQTDQNYTRLLNRDYESQKRLVRGHADSKRTQMPAQPTIPSKTLNQHRWRKQNITGKTKFKQYLLCVSINLSLQKILEGKLQHKEGTYTKRKDKILSISQHR